jgi:NAD-dependent dihydropyrimidine dehydrogenase PreA subunit
LESAMTKKLAVVFSKDRSPRSAAERLQSLLAARLGPREEIDLRVLPHLYDLAPDGPGMDYLRSVEGDLVVLAWLYPRATYWLLDANRVRGRMGRTEFFPEEELPAAPPADDAEQSSPARGKAKTGKAARDDLPERTIWCLDARAFEEPAALLGEIDRIAFEATGVERPAAAEELVAAADANGVGLVEESTRPRWYPVVDYSRCAACLECLNFCLFGVFGIDETERLLVEQADACRDGCPACARVCPSGAIMFPMHGNPAVAGDPRLPLGALQADLVQLFGPAGRREMAAAERERILGKDKLDELVDGVEQSEL